MHLSRMLVMAVLALVLATPVIAEQTLPYQLAFNGSNTNRYFADQKIGTIANGGVQYYLDSGSDRVLALEYYTNDNQVTRTSGVELGEESFGFGVYAPVAPVKIKLAGSVERYMLGADYWAFGVYPQLDRGHSRYNLGIERDADATVLTSGRFSTSGPVWSGSIGLSSETFRDRDQEQRVGLEIARHFSQVGLMTIAGAAVNPEDAPTWIAGIGHPASADPRSSINPAVVGFVNRKPEAVSVMGLATLWGQMLSPGMYQGVGESMFNGSLSRTRVVRNRDFNTVGVGGGYDAIDFGRVVASFNYGDVDAGSGVHVRSSNVGLFGTLPRRLPFLGAHVDDPFIGVDRQIITDLVVNVNTRKLEDRRQDWTTLTFGCKIRVNANTAPSPVKQAGYLRLKMWLRFGERFDGAYLGATLWN